MLFLSPVSSRRLSLVSSSLPSLPPSFPIRVMMFGMMSVSCWFLVLPGYRASSTFVGLLASQGHFPGFTFTLVTSASHVIYPHVTVTSRPSFTLGMCYVLLAQTLCLILRTCEPPLSPPSSSFAICFVSLDLISITYTSTFTNQ